MPSSASDVVKVEADGPVRIVTLNRPEHANAVNSEMHKRFSQVWSEIADDREARAVMLTGAGSYFSGGGDLAEWMSNSRKDPVSRRSGMREARRIVRDLIDFPLPLVAAVNGPAVGFGCSIVALCDIVLLSDRAFFADIHVANGMTAGDGGSVVWPLLMSLIKAKEYLLLGERIPAHVAVELGMANRVVPHSEVKREALQLTHRLAELPAHAVQDTKRALNLHIERAISGILEYSLSAEVDACSSPEHHAAVDRFLERDQDLERGPHLAVVPAASRHGRSSTERHE